MEHCASLHCSPPSFTQHCPHPPSGNHSALRVVAVVIRPPPLAAHMGTAGYSCCLRAPFEVGVCYVASVCRALQSPSSSSSVAGLLMHSYDTFAIAGSLCGCNELLLNRPHTSECRLHFVTSFERFGEKATESTWFFRARSADSSASVGVITSSRLCWLVQRCWVRFRGPVFLQRVGGILPTHRSSPCPQWQVAEWIAYGVAFDEKDDAAPSRLMPIRCWHDRSRSDFGLCVCTPPVVEDQIRCV